MINDQKTEQATSYIHRATARNSKRPPLTPLYQRAPAPARPLPDCTLPIPTIPHLDNAVQAGGRHVPPTLARVDGETKHGPKVREHTHGRVGEVRRPERHGAVLVAKVDHGVVCVLRHRRAAAQLCAVFDDQLARRGVLVFQVAWVALYPCGVRI